MQAFLDKTAEYLYKTWGKDMGDMCIVLPNRRSGLFLKKFLSGYAQKTIWSPEIASIEDFITGLSGCNIIDPVYLQFELYKIYNEAEGEKAGSFIEFLKWGRVLLNDFNEIDKYLIDPASLFDYLTDIRAIELWNPEKGILTAFELNYLHFYKSLKTYYEKLIKILVEKREVYSGLAYRMVAAKAEEYAAQSKWKKVVFAGFNALTTSEKKIIFTLVAAGKAEVIWDTDRYYMDDELQEAGRFIRSYIREFDVKEYKWPDDNFKKEEFRIHLLGVPQNVLQAKTAGNLLAEISKDNRELERTAVVLNDEFMLAPLLNSIPDSIGDFNLTMGLSLKSTPLYQLIDSVFNLQVNILKLNPEAINKRKIYFRDILRVLEHPYLSSTGEQKDLLQLPGKIRSSNKVFFNFDELMTYLPDPIPDTTLLFDSLFKPWGNFPAVALERIVILINLLKSKYSGNNLKSNSEGDVASIDLEYLFYFSKIFQKLKVLLQQYSIIDTLSTFRELFIQLSGSLNIPFYGEPLKGLQVMGMLETQALDFDNLIMLSTNEGLIPSGKSANSFIPFEIRCRFSLPTYKERNAVFAYHFYRLLQRTKSAYFLYNTEHGDLGGDEKSRFITQLLYELPKYNPAVRIKEEILALPVVEERKENPIVISKDPEILKRLLDIAEKGISASVINTWRNCSLQFYFKYIAGLEETAEAEETIEAGTLGTVVHEVLREFFTPLKNKPLNAGDAERMKLYIESFTRKAFTKHYKDGDIDYGKNLLIVRVVNEFISNFLEKELHSMTDTDYSPVILEVEKKFETHERISANGNEIKIRLKGFIDRIDRTGKKIRIIDYKTGKVEPRDIKFKEWDLLKSETKLDKCFQLLFYAYLYWKENKPDVTNLEPGIISFRNLKGGFFQVCFPEDESMSEIVLRKFGGVLDTILMDIYNPVLPFAQTEIPENCSYCPFRPVCNRN